MILRIGLILLGLYAVLCAIVYVSRHRMIFPVRGVTAGNPADFRLADGIAVAIPSDSGHSFAAWFLPAVPTPASGKPGVLIWFHGNAETLGGLAPIFRMFRPAGVAMLAVEYQGYGSPGFATVENVERDAIAAWEWLAQRGDVDMAKVVIYGRSIGTGPAIHLAAARPAAGLIIESGFTTMRRLAHAHFPFIPSIFAGSGFNSIADIARARCPVLLIHGDRDATVPTAMGRELAAAAGARGELWIIAGAGHNDTYDLGGEEYVRRVRTFVLTHAT
jgi:fermentation-respiration switch protein FrsA (DUF1100 family)